MSLMIKKIAVYNAKLNRKKNIKEAVFQARKRAHFLNGKQRMDRHKQKFTQYKRKFLSKKKRWSNRWKFRAAVWDRRQLKWDHRSQSSK